jgi:hypothetical protein
VLPPQAITQFKELYRKRFGEELSNAEAQRRAQRFFSLYKAVFGPPRLKVALAEKVELESGVHVL